MRYSTRIFTMFLLFLCTTYIFSIAEVHAQTTTLILCSSNTSGLVTARTKCRKSETRVNPPTARFDDCYWRFGTPVSLDGKTSQVTVSETCTAGDVLVNHSVFHNDTGNGTVQISSIAFTSPSGSGSSHSLPQGITAKINLVSLTQPPIPNGANINAEINLLCCPYK